MRLLSQANSQPRMKLDEMMPLDRAFHVRSASIYYTQVKDFKEKRNKKGRIIRVGRQLPFTLTEFRAWLSEKLGNRSDGAVKCAYCPKIISALDFRVDHDEPVSRGGSLALENLILCCDVCNREKGELTSAEYQEVIATLDLLLSKGLLGPQGYKDVRKRLRGSLMMFKPKKKAESIPPHVPIKHDPDCAKDLPF